MIDDRYSSMLPLNATAPRVIADLIKSTPLSAGKIEFVWRASVGPALSRVTRVRLGSDGVLYVQADDRRWISEIRRSTTIIAARLNTLLGEEVVKQIKAQHA